VDRAEAEGGVLPIFGIVEFAPGAQRTKDKRLLRSVGFTARSSIPIVFSLQGQRRGYADGR
jgi:hypothetical protein